MCSVITATILSGCGRCSYRNMTENIKQKIILAKTTAKQKKPQKSRKICGFFFYTVLYSKYGNCERAEQLQGRNCGIKHKGTKL